MGYLEVVHVLRDSHLLAVDDFVADAWVVRVHDESIAVEVAPEFAVEKKCRFEASVQRFAQFHVSLWCFENGYL